MEDTPQDAPQEPKEITILLRGGFPETKTKYREGTFEVHEMMINDGYLTHIRIKLKGGTSRHDTVYLELPIDDFYSENFWAFDYYTKKFNVPKEAYDYMFETTRWFERETTRVLQDDDLVYDTDDDAIPYSEWKRIHKDFENEGTQASENATATTVITEIEGVYDSKTGKFGVKAKELKEVKEIFKRKDEDEHNSDES